MTIPISTSLKKKLPSIRRQFFSEVVFGMPSKGCKNFGICKIIPIGSLNLEKEQSTIALVTVFNHQHVELDFLRTAVHPTQYAQYFSRDYFLVRERFQFALHKNADYHFSIRKGEYSILKSNTLIKVVFKS